MVDQVKTLLLNPSGVAGYHRVSDAPSDAAMARFGVSGDGGVSDAAVVDRLLPLALAPDLAHFRGPYDRRVTPSRPSSVYRRSADELSPAGLYDHVLGREGWWAVSPLFQHPDPAVYAVLAEMRGAAMSGDAPYALGAVLLAVAYRRQLMQRGGD